jgi:uncharacterized protein (DUF433 family)
MRSRTRTRRSNRKRKPEGDNVLSYPLFAPLSRATIEAVSKVVHIDPEILGGTPVFRGTRVPVETFFDYIEGGEPLSEFLEDFPTVTQEQVLELLQEVKSEILPSVRAV